MSYVHVIHLSWSLKTFLTLILFLCLYENVHIMGSSLGKLTNEEIYIIGIFHIMFVYNIFFIDGDKEFILNRQVSIGQSYVSNAYLLRKNQYVRAH